MIPELVTRFNSLLDAAKAAFAKGTASGFKEADLDLTVAKRIIEEAATGQVQSDDHRHD